MARILSSRAFRASVTGGRRHARRRVDDDGTTFGRWFGGWLGGWAFVHFEAGASRAAQCAELAATRGFAAVIGSEERILEEIGVLPQRCTVASTVRRCADGGDFTPRVSRRRCGLRPPRRCGTL